MLKIGVNAKFFVFLEQKFVMWGGTCYNNRTWKVERESAEMKEQHDILTGMLNCTEAASILLAMTTSLADENALKELLQKQGYKFAVTELGGDASKSEFREKMTRSIIGACLNCSVISKTAQEIHAVLHAAADAKSGYSQNLLQANISCKVAIVRGNGWIAVTFYGDSAAHYITNHKRMGFGIMHI